MARKKKFKPTQFMAEGSYYDEDQADYVVNFIQCLCHTKGKWAGKPFILMPWQEEIIRNIFGVLKADGKRQFTTAYIEIPKKNGKSDAKGEKTQSANLNQAKNDELSEG